jgi:1-acyl-sn-glycerol-3-phosphate acyltransferase
MRLSAEAEARVARALAALSTSEIAAAVGAGGAPAAMRALVELVARVPSRRLGRSLARFDASIAERGLAAAARSALASFGVRLEVEGGAPEHGAALLVTNHPGAYDALAMMASTGRDDVALVAADRAFLRAMPGLSEHLVFVADAEAGAAARMLGLRRALAWLASGRALVQYGAGAIEPDARFTRPGEDVLGAWAEGTSVLAARAARLGAPIVPVFISGVHSARAKRLPFVRWAERRGITTVAPLVQATLPGFRDVVITVRFGAPIAHEALFAARSRGARTSLVRAAVAALAPRSAEERGADLGGA